MSTKLKLAVDQEAGIARLLGFSDVELVVSGHHGNNFSAEGKSVARVPVTSDFSTVSRLLPHDRFVLPEDAWTILLRLRTWEGLGWRAEVKPRRTVTKEGRDAIDVVVDCRMFSGSVFVNSVRDDMCSHLRALQDQLAAELVELGEIVEVEVL